jgi:hypothetical protein
MDAMGVSRYLPVFVYVKGAPDKAAYFGHQMEGFQKEVRPFWVATAQTSSSGSVDAMGKAIDHIGRLGLRPRCIGVEMAFLPLDAGMALRSAFAGVDIADALIVLERLRARKSADELQKLRIASDGVIDSMLAVIANHGPGTTKQELTEALRREETNRGLTFEYCLIAAGTSHNRAASEQRWEAGDVLSLDSGGNYRGYIGDLARMAILGEPDAELGELLTEIEEIQQFAFRSINAGAMGGSMFEVVVSVRMIDFAGRIQECAPSAMAVTYRSCATLKTQLALEALLRGKKESRELIERRMNELSRRRWESQPAASSAGCMFKNTPSIPAGKLIDELGLKGTRIDGAMVSLEHGNFLVNDGTATARDVLELIELIRSRARADRRIELETEVEIIGE